MLCMFNNLGRFLQLHYAHSVWTQTYQQHLGKMIFCRSYSSCGNRFSLVSAKDEKLTNAIKILLLQNTSNWIYAPIALPPPSYYSIFIQALKSLNSQVPDYQQVPTYPTKYQEYMLLLHLQKMERMDLRGNQTLPGCWSMQNKFLGCFQVSCHL